MAALPYMQLYIADYLADTMHLSTEEHGAYLLLMFNYWQTGKPIPKSRLAKIARMSNDRWNSVEESLGEFFTDDGTEWRHERIECDLENVLASLEQKSAAGKASAAKRRALKETKTQRETNVRSTGVDIPLEQKVNENPTNKDPDKDKDLKPKKHMSGSKKKPNQTPPPGDKNYPEDFEILWREYPKRSGSSGKAGALKAWQARCREGISPETMLDAVRRYRTWCQAEGVIGTQFVRLAQTFLGAGHEFDNPWEVNPGGKNYGQHAPGHGESAAVRTVSEDCERWEQERRENSGPAALGADGRGLRPALDHEEWVTTVNALGDPGGQHER